MRGVGPAVASALPIAVSTAATFALYSQQALLLLLKVGEVFSGVFDTSVPAYPLAGMLFSLIFLAMRREEFLSLLQTRSGGVGFRGAGVVIALAPLLALLYSGPQLGSSYSFAGLALVCSWVGILLALRPSLFYFLSPYLVLYVLAVGLIGMLTDTFGDPLALVVAAISRGITGAFGLPVQWSTVYINFVAAGGQGVSLVITQECSGIASMSIFLLVLGLMHLDLRASIRTSAFFAVGGSLLFIFLNSLRVVGLIVGGLYVSTGFMWSLHGWLGYALYVGGYALILVLYIGRRNTTKYDTSK